MFSSNGGAGGFEPRPQGFSGPWLYPIELPSHLGFWATSGELYPIFKLNLNLGILFILNFNNRLLKVFKIQAIKFSPLN